MESASSVAKRILGSQSFLLSTHRQADGDGLGAQTALFHGLKKLGKNVRILNVDQTPKKYDFLEEHTKAEYFETPHSPVEKTDLALIFDTNDRRLLNGLFLEIEKKCKNICFIDHHPVLEQGPIPTKDSWIEVKAASTGEMVYDILKELKVEFDTHIAEAIYTSIVFDTHIFKFLRKSPKSHLIAAEMMSHNIDTEKVHRKLFAQHTVTKVAFLAKILSAIEYSSDGKVALVKVQTQDMIHHSMDLDETRDIIDFLMDIESVEAAILFREDAPNEYKLSLRSKGSFDVLTIAEAVGGGGHHFSSGAFLKGNYQELKSKILKLLDQKIQAKKNG